MCMNFSDLGGAFEGCQRRVTGAFGLGAGIPDRGKDATGAPTYEPEIAGVGTCKTR